MRRSVLLAFEMASFEGSCAVAVRHVPTKVSLLIASRADPASETMARALTSRGLVNKVEGLDNVYESNECAQPFYLWWQDAPLLGLDHAELAFLGEVKDSLPALEREGISDIVFLSRHSAATGKPSLTVHPIGVPGTVDTDYMGGISGRASPPNFRIGALYRSLLASTKDSSLEGEFEVTLEATHHGPHTDLPACFVEIGSTEAEWGRADAGELWADVLSEHYGGSGAFRDAATTAVVLIGGGHYCPKMGDVARMGEQVAVGHILAQYAIKDYLEGNVAEAEAVEGGWRHVIDEALAATRASFPAQKLVVLVDKKWKSAMRAHITGYLDELGMAWTHNFKRSDVGPAVAGAVSAEGAQAQAVAAGGE